MEKITVNSLTELDEFATRYANTVKSGDTILLNGDLGAGKTTFTSMVLNALGVKTVVNSPTFAILKTYIGKFKFNHFDTYRISTDEAIEAGFDEILNEKDSVNFIEWSENILPLLPTYTRRVNIKVIDENTREIEFDE